MSGKSNSMKELQRSLLLLVMAGVAVGGYFTLKGYKAETEEKEAKSKRISQLDAKQVNRFTIERQGKSPVKFEKRAGKWWVVDPETYLANTVTVDAILQAMESKEHSSSFESSDLTQFDLNPPKYTIRMAAAAGTEVTLEFGKSTPVGNDIYTHIPGAKEILLVSSGFDYNFNKEITDYRSRDLFWDFPQSISAITLLSDGKAAQLEQRDGKWYSGATSLDTEKVTAHIGRIKGMTAQKFEVDSATESELKHNFGFDGKKEIILASAKGELVLKVGKKPDDNAFFVQTSDRPNVYRVGKYNIDPLFKEVKDFVKTPPKPVTAPTETAPHGGMDFHGGEPGLRAG